MKNYERKLEQWASKEIQRNISNVILPSDDGDLIVFGTYCLREQNQSYAVHSTNNFIGNFGSKKTALSYCIADKYNRLNLAREILTLDRKKQILQADIHTSQTLAAKSKQSNWAETVNTKIQPKIEMLKSVSRELEKCVNLAKYLQIRGFNNETDRTSGTTSRKTTF